MSRPGDEEREVDVGRHDLLVIEAGPTTAAVGGHPPEGAASRQDRAHDVVAVDRHPVADGREVRAGERSEPERTGHDGRPVAGPIADDRGFAMDGDNARRAKARGRMRLEGLRPGGVPAERRERVVRARRPAASMPAGLSG